MAPLELKESREVMAAVRSECREPRCRQPLRRLGHDRQDERMAVGRRIVGVAMWDDP
jgi:hypothetical protein